MNVSGTIITQCSYIIQMEEQWKKEGKKGGLSHFDSLCKVALSWEKVSQAERDGIITLYGKSCVD